MHATSDQLLTRRETARELRCSESSVKRYAALGLKPIKIGPRLVRYRLSNIIDFQTREVSTK